MNIAFQHMENISKALDAMKTVLNIQDRDIFTTGNLYQQDNIAQVVHCLLHLQKIFFPGSVPPTPRAGGTFSTGAFSSAVPAPVLSAPPAKLPTPVVDVKTPSGPQRKHQNNQLLLLHHVFKMKKFLNL